ncbi:MAG: hypothetical protein LIO77_00465 [Rikenellaceae bacterium]|nr:hypothetical protein [Rikenellaceae bacterium]
MEYDIILSNIHKALDKKYPSGASKNNIVRRVLGLDKMGAYRRLNGLVQFKVHELAALCSELHLSAEIIFNVPKRKTLSMDMQMPDYSGYGIDDHELHKRSLEILDMAVRGRNSKHVLGCNMIPHSIITEFDYILRFCLCKWLYFRNETGMNIPLSKVWLADDLVKIKKDIERRHTQFDATIIVWDNKIIESFLGDILYFYRINLVNEQEVEKLKEELHSYINFMDSLATRGCHSYTGTPVYCYISSVSIDSNYGFIDSDSVKASVLQAFILNIGWNTDPDAFEYVRSWMNTLIRSSTLISTSGELARTEFFNRQHRMIDTFI